MSAVGMRRALKQGSAEDVLASLANEGVTLDFDGRALTIRDAEADSRDVWGLDANDPTDVKGVLTAVFCGLLGRAWARACRPFVARMVDIWGAALLALLASRAQDALKGGGDVPR